MRNFGGASDAEYSGVYLISAQKFARLVSRAARKHYGKTHCRKVELTRQLVKFLNIVSSASFSDGLCFL